MIAVSGSTHMTFHLPVSVADAFAFYSDMQRLIPYLPHIRLVKTHADNHLRVCYFAKELTAYDINIYCDILVETDPLEYAIRVMPHQVRPFIKPKAGIQAASTYGRYTSESLFFPDGNGTRLEYSLELSAELPEPWALKLIPDPVLNSIASHITNARIDEIAHQFIQQSAAAIPAWAANGKVLA
ncbi:MAG TPA: hypothetical protein EYP41_04340 [Anaerolineae bacterium]|nr:hypothetical protein [Anaerolineae bacterium]